MHNARLLSSAKRQVHANEKATTGPQTPLRQQAGLPLAEKPLTARSDDEV
jgi:hypothetical protein